MANYRMRNCRKLHEGRRPIALRLRRYIILTTSAFFLLNILIPYLSRQKLPLLVVAPLAHPSFVAHWAPGDHHPYKPQATQTPPRPHPSEALPSTLALAPIKASGGPLLEVPVPLVAPIKPQESFFPTLTSDAHPICARPPGPRYTIHGQLCHEPRLKLNFSNVAQPASI